MTPLLQVDNLTVQFPSPHGLVDVVKGITFSLGRERLAIVGESGSGKSMTARAIMQLLQPPARVSADRLQFDGLELQNLSAKQMRQLRGARLSMIMQDPKFSLNPVMTIGAQILESLKTHEVSNKQTRQAHMIDMLHAVGIEDGERVAKLYPHQVSGGMGQRIMIAMMLVPKPDLLIADEPTSALDVSIRAQVLQLMDGLIQDNAMGLILISHDLHLVARYCDRVMVMYAGQIVETCRAQDLHKAQHPYTQGLLAAVPQVGEKRDYLPTLDNSQWSAS